MNGQENIEEMFAFVVRDDDGTEGVIGAYMQTGWMPLVGADMARVESLIPAAQRVSTQINKPVHLVKFSVREELRTIEPSGGTDA